jgi:hypothetical protein
MLANFAIQIRNLVEADAIPGAEWRVQGLSTIHSFLAEALPAWPGCPSQWEWKFASWIRTTAA